MTSCRALVSTAPFAAEVAEVPVADELAGGGIGEVLAAGVCGTDVALFGDAPLSARVRPLVLGHENVVRIERAEPLLAERWSVHVGDRVLVEEYVPCGQCLSCRRGLYRVCPRTDYLAPSFLRYGRMPLAGRPGPWGGFSEKLYLHPDTALHPVPPALADEHAVMAVPLANAIRWLTDVAAVQPDTSVVVFGPGAIGLSCVIAAQQAGAANVVLIGLPGDRGRLAVGAALGADPVLVVGEDDIVDQLRTATGGRGADVVADATGGSSAALELAVTCTGFGGTILLPSATGPLPATVTAAAAERELTLRGVRGHDGHSLRQALRFLASGRFDIQLLTGRPVALTDAARTLNAMSTPTPDRPAHVSIIPQL